MAASRHGFDARAVTIEPALINQAGEGAILQQALEHETVAGVPMDVPDRLAQNQGAHEIIDQIDKGRGGRHQAGQFLRDRILALTTEFLDGAVKGLLAGKMFVEQRLGNAGRLRQVLGGGFGIALPGEERQGRRHNRPLPVLRRHAPPFHAHQVSARSPKVNGFFVAPSSDDQ
jgi:hypothetical protein